MYYQFSLKKRVIVDFKNLVKGGLQGDLEKGHHSCTRTQYKPACLSPSMLGLFVKSASLNWKSNIQFKYNGP